MKAAACRVQNYCWCLRELRHMAAESGHARASVSAVCLTVSSTGRRQISADVCPARTGWRTCSLHTLAACEIHKLQIQPKLHAGS